MGFNHGMHVPFVSVLGTLINYDDDDDDNNDNAKKKKQQQQQKLVYEQNNSSASRFLVHLFDIHCTTMA